MAMGLLVGYERWPSIGWYHSFMIVWSKYQLGLPSAPLHHGITLPVRISTVCQIPETAPLHSSDGRQLPAVWAVRVDCEIVYIKSVHGYVMIQHGITLWKRFLYHRPFVRGINRSPVDSPHKGLVIWSFDVFCDVCLNKILNTQPGCRWFEVLSIVVLKLSDV